MKGVIMNMDKKDIIKKFVIETFLKGNESAALTDDSSFIEDGIIDSVGVLELVAFIEETFSFRVEDEDIIPENLDSINKIVDYISSKPAGIEARRTD